MSREGLRLDLEDRAWVAEILRVPGDGVAVQAAMAGIVHQGLQFLFFPLFSQFTEMLPVASRVFARGVIRI